jgi:hypothetical protein
VHFCLLRNFGHEIDRAIAYALSKYYAIIESQRKLKRIIESEEYLERTIHEKTFRYRIKKMLEAGFIFIDEQEARHWKRAKKLPLRLSSEVLDQIKLGNLVLQYDARLNSSSYSKYKRQRKREDERLKAQLMRNAIYYIIMRVMSIETPYKYSKPPGFSVSDIIKGRLDGHAFYYLDLNKDRRLVKECIKKLQEENIIKGSEPITEGGTRYELADYMWKDFVIDCEELLENTIMNRLHLVWYNIRRPSPEERIFYELCWGEKHTDVHMNWIYNYGNEEKHKKRFVKTEHRSDDDKRLRYCIS